MAYYIHEAARHLYSTHCPWLYDGSAMMLTRNIVFRISVTNAHINDLLQRFKIVI